MLQNYLLTAYRDAKRNKTSSAINLIGLSAGIAAFLLIYHFVLFEKSYDSFHEQAASIYRVPFIWESLAKGNVSELYASNVPAFGPALKNDFPQVVAYARLFDVHTLIPYCVLTYVNEAGTKITYNESKGYYADPGFLSMFSFPLLWGDKASVLLQPQSIVLTKSTAYKYFGKYNPIGKTIGIKNGREQLNYMVTGVLEDIPANSHLQFDFLLSFASLGNGSVNQSWVWSQFYTYIQLQKGANPKDLEAKLPTFLKKYNGEECEYEVFLQPVEDIHLTSHLRYETSINGSERTVNFLLIIAFLILMIAWINYINLSSAKALERAREVGVRKAIGASRRQLFTQFLLQAFLSNALAIALAIGLIAISLPLYITRATGGVIDIFMFFQASFWLTAGMVMMIGSMISGLYPALLLSSYKPVEALKGKLKNTPWSLLVRKLLVVGQFASCVSLSIFTLVVLKQFNFMRSQDLGIKIDQTLVLQLTGGEEPGSKKSIDYFKGEALKIPQVSNSTFSSSIPEKEITITRGMKRGNGEPKGNTNFFFVGIDENFTNFYDIKLLAGRSFTKQHVAADKGHSVVVNQEALQILQIASPEQAIGEKVLVNGEPPALHIVGVIENYHNKSLDQPIEPIVLYLDTLGEGYISLQLQGSTNVTSTLQRVESAYKAAFGDEPLNYFFLDDFFNRQYQSEKRNVAVFTSFAILAILIACLGMIGLTTYAISGRMKEIGVRKVLGANTSQLVRLLLKDLMQTIWVASILAWPVAYLAASLYLDHYPYRIKISWLYFFIPSVGVGILALMAILYQTLQAARTTPTTFLKNR